MLWEIDVRLSVRRFGGPIDHVGRSGAEHESYSCACASELPGEVAGRRQAGRQSSRAPPQQEKADCRHCPADQHNGGNPPLVEKPGPKLRRYEEADEKREDKPTRPPDGQVE